MKLKGKRVLLCDCEQTMPLDPGELAKACRELGGEGDPEIQTQLCRSQLGNFQRAILGDDPLLVACTQEAPLFTEVAAEDNPQATPRFADIRESAGWSAEAKAAGPKIAALLAEAALEIAPTPVVPLESKGVCLVYGRDARALDAARQLADRLEVTVLLTEPQEVLPPRIVEVPVFRGTITQARGHLGNFGINVSGYAAAKPSSRHALDFEPPKDNAFSECDLILDLTGGPPLFTGGDRRDGYLRPDPGNPGAVQKAIFEIAALVGEFEKPRYIAFDAKLCAHGRSAKTGCTRCLDLCPLGAISSAGDQVAIDPFVCGGCGACASACPTGAATYHLPPVESLFTRLQTLLSAYHEAGGKNGVLLVHDARHGGEVISLMARFGRGLPARVLPFAVNEITQTGLDLLLTALAFGAQQVAFLATPDKAEERGGLAQQIGLAETILTGLGYGSGRIHLLDQPDPEAVEAALYGLPHPEAIPKGGFMALGGKRTRSMLALRHLHDHAPAPVDILPLPAGAPFGAVEVDTAGCTLCLACVGTCPTGALQDDPERPWLGFNEEACVQCGLCRATCPEEVIALAPRLNFTGEAKGSVALNEAEPFHCIRCGKPFGVAASIERIVERLAGQHSMFLEGDQVERIMMCEDCRVVVQFEAPDNPFQGQARPIPRTTDDYLREREVEEARDRLRAERGDDPEEGSLH